MKQKIYVVVEKEFYSDDETLTGNKTIYLYIIKNDDLVEIDRFDCLNEDDDLKVITEHITEELPEFKNNFILKFL